VSGLGDIAGRVVVCVVGAGPRGVSVVERLCANARGREVVVHLVDPYLGRGSRVWDVGQSPSLLMNTVASQVTMFTDDSVTCDGPVAPGPSLYEWARALALFEPFEQYPAAVHVEARGLGPDTYSSRAFYGHYLDWVVRRLCVTAPPGVVIRLHRQSAVAVEDDGGAQVVTLADGTVLAGLDAVVLALGHVDMPPSGAERALGRFAVRHGLRYQPSANPAEVDVRHVRAGEAVVLRGMGLSFFDYLPMLTVERGGRFEREPDGRLVYRPSGREPVIHAGSRRGVPYHARGENEKGVSGRHEPRFLTHSVIARLRRGAVTFGRDVWPLISREVQHVYYTTLLRERGGDAEGFAERVVDGDLTTLPQDFGIAPADRWDWDRVATPHGDRRFADPREFHAWLLDLLREDVRRARRGNVTDPVKAALDVLRDLRNEVRLAVDHGGLTGTSYRDELVGWYTPLNAYLSIGPPVLRIEEMIALIEAGVLHVVGPGFRVDTRGGVFVARSPAVAGSETPATTLIEARLPEVDMRTSNDPLLSRLRATGSITPYRIPDPHGEVETGGLAVTARPYRVVDARGRPHPARFGYGIPTESVHWVTAAGVRPGVDSVILKDADAMARAVLATARAATAPAPPARSTPEPREDP
jgi:FAD-NAD(P)-binding